MEMSGRDRFRELPAKILDMILGFLPIMDAARMAVLSSLWKDSWLSLSNLCFDPHFFIHIEDKYSSYYHDGDIRDKRVIYDNENVDILVSMSLYVINKVLLHHKGPIRKFCFIFNGDEGSLRSRLFDIDQWLALVTRKGVEEIRLSFYEEDRFLLPDCVFSCPTLRRLHLAGASYDIAIAPRELVNFTELCFSAVEFEEPNGLPGHTIQAPMLEDLSFYACDETIFCFDVNAPKLCTLTIQSCSYDQIIDDLPLNSTFLERVRTLVLDPYSIKYFFHPFSRSGISLQPCVLNLECLKLVDDPLHCDPYREWLVYCDISYAFIWLLQICPKLRKLHMHIQVVEVVSNCLKRESEHSKELYRVAQTLNSLRTLRVSYGGPHYASCEKSLSWLEGLLSSFPTLDKFVIGGRGITRKHIHKILRFPRASPNVEVVFIE